MAYNQKSMLRDASGFLIPQFFDEVEDTFKPLGDPTKKKSKILTFHTGATTKSNGNTFDVGTFRDVSIDITGTSTNCVLVFEHSMDGGTTWRGITGVDVTELTTGKQTTGTNQTWSFTVAGLSKFRVRIDSISNGNVTVKGITVE